MNNVKLKKVLLGTHEKNGVIFNIGLYTLLIGFSFIFLYPLIKMFSTSFMTLEDLIDPTAVWIPNNFTWQNYAKTFESLKVFEALSDSFVVSIAPTVCVLLSSSLIGYGFARFTFPLKNLCMALMIGTFLIPNILMSIPSYVKYFELGLTGTLKVFTFPALTGFGLRQTLFILIFYQFFKNIPNELFEAADVDGCGTIRTFISIAIPCVLPAFLISGLYCFVWYWNETSLALTYKIPYNTLPMAISNFENTFKTLYGGTTSGLGSASDTFNEAVLFAGTLVSIMPLLLIYLVAQKWFIEGIDRSGIAGS